MRKWIDLRQFGRLVKHLERNRQVPKVKIISELDNYFDDMSRQLGDGDELGEGEESGPTRMPWLSALKHLPLKLDCYYYIKYDEDALPDAYTTFLTAAARLVGTSSGVIHFLVKTYFEHDNVDATIDRIIYRIQD